MALTRILALRLAAICLSLASTGCSSSQVRSLTILHTNDLHARLLPDDRGRGGFAQMATAIREERAKSEAALVLHAGDLVQGSPVSSIFRGLPVVEVANLIGFDLHVLGNHEFDYGWERTQEFIQASRFSTVTANVVDRDGRLLAPAAYEIRDVGGLRVGVIGLVTERLADMTRAKLLGPWRALPVAETARRYAAEIEPTTDLIIALCHCFDDEDEAVLREAPDVDIVVSGHNHGGARQVLEIDGRLRVKVRAWGRELGRLDLLFDPAAERVVSHEWTILPVTAERYAADPRTLAAAEKWEACVAEEVDKPIGRARREMGKAELKPWIERVMREAVGADLAYMNEGGIRDSLSAGALKSRHIWNVEPFGNELYSGVVRGSRLPPELADRPGIEPERLYRVATNSFIAEKWRERDVDLPDEGPLVRDLLIEWIKEHGEIP